jgi:hypothetical protein
MGALRESFTKMVVSVQQAHVQIGSNTRQMASSADYLRTLQSFFRGPSRTGIDSVSQMLVELDRLRQRLVGEQLRFCQSRFALTRSGSEEQMQVAQQTYRFLAQCARESMMASAANVDAKVRIADLGSRNELQMVAAEQKPGNLSASEAITQEQQLLRETWAFDERALAARKDLGIGGRSTGQETGPDEVGTYFSYLAQQEELIQNAATQLRQNWESAFEPISDQLAVFSTEVITRTKSMQKAFDEMMRSIIDDFLKASFRSFFNNLLGIGGGGDGGAGGGSGGGLLGGLNPLGLLGSAIGGLFKNAIGATLGTAIGNPFEAGAGGLVGGSLAGLLGGALGTSIGNTTADFSSAAGGALGFGVGLLGKLASMLPFAAGGWDIPHFAAGGILSVVHGGEMVLPRNISDGLRGAIAGGSFGGGHTINISAVDAASVARLFRRHGHDLVAALNSAVRNGAGLVPAT